MGNSSASGGGGDYDDDRGDSNSKGDWSDGNDKGGSDHIDMRTVGMGFTSGASDNDFFSNLVNPSHGDFFGNHSDPFAAFHLSTTDHDNNPSFENNDNDHSVDKGSSKAEARDNDIYEMMGYHKTEGLSSLISDLQTGKCTTDIFHSSDSKGNAFDFLHSMNNMIPSASKTQEPDSPKHDSSIFSSRLAKEAADLADQRRRDHEEEARFEEARRMDLASSQRCQPNFNRASEVRQNYRTEVVEKERIESSVAKRRDADCASIVTESKTIGTKDRCETPIEAVKGKLFDYSIPSIVINDKSEQECSATTMLGIYDNIIGETSTSKKFVEKASLQNLFHTAKKEKE
eukprot:TRINITY_DN1740_c1_g1_i1.p1 TRINITY_DN1740_c1_g1~~TRINITY_DN1740_c1_g1_i1.p1  ORF type:complete len:344 (-),score=57.02 TRINITY_DN1740_c1_g1_i1:133-1164(-)